MRFLTRVHVLSALGICSILYFGWILPSLHITTRINKVWSGSSHQLVVFGDDWSDIGEYRISPPDEASAPIRDADQGGLWTEVLCKELVCDYIDNFARSALPSKDGGISGALVDNDVYMNATSHNKTDTKPLADFKMQVQQWINFEKQKRLMPGRQGKDEWTVFTVMFGVWDLWQYAALEKARAVYAIEGSIEELFHQLNTIAENSDGPIRVVLPLLFDVTFLPRFQMRKGSSAWQFAQNQHQAVFLLTYWNTALSRAASSWTAGDLFLPDINSVLVNEVRAKQLYAMGITDASGAGKQVPLFDEVETPCLAPVSESESTQDKEENTVTKCNKPTRHLFWDDMHLGGTAHGLIGREAAGLVNGNKTVNEYAREQKMSKAAINGNRHNMDSLNFRLHFPPE
ncbi:hypothetical protein AOQ84DRAFT_399180 [Glonium stellatum]|uniref:Uncharacterized protein n=1 Tax=Glonium stellatum TaxID=574774 RepID=A0A8E2EWD4_9PEZI|nr:hypothetical protein AOQ84DRAFT_399180 [Glonium stellatum]